MQRYATNYALQEKVWWGKIDHLTLATQYLDKNPMALECITNNWSLAEILAPSARSNVYKSSISN